MDAVDELFERLDSIMSDTPPGVGVAMGCDLYLECRKRNLLEMKEFSVLGTGFLPHWLPAYRGKHFTFLHPELPDFEFQIGTPRHA